MPLRSPECLYQVAQPLVSAVSSSAVRSSVSRRSYNLYSDVQKGENVVVEIPVQAGEKHFKYEQKVKLVNPKLYGRGYAIGDMGHTDYVLLADDIVAVEEK